MHKEKRYHDEIWLINDDDSEEFIWRNNERSDYFKSDNDEDSEYNKMMELNNKYYFADWENAPYFEHRIIETTYKITKNLLW